MVKIRYAEYSDKEYWFSVDQHMPESEFEYKVQMLTSSSFSISF